MNNLLTKIINNKLEEADSYNIRENGKTVKRKENEYVKIVNKPDSKGIDIYIKENTLFGIIDIPVIISKSGFKDVVYNDFHVGENANVIIVAGCGIHNIKHKTSEHDGIHRFYLSKNSKVKYIEKHYGEGTGNKIFNPITEAFLEEGATLNIETVQIKGVDKTTRITKADLKENATLTINEKLYTEEKQYAKTEFVVNLNGENSSAHVTSRSVATQHSYQEFTSNVIGNNKSFAHVSCDAIIKDKAQVKAIPLIYAKDASANLIHEAAIGKIAGQQLIKLMSLGLTLKEAEKTIIEGFLK